MHKKISVGQSIAKDYLPANAPDGWFYFMQFST